MGNPNPNPAIMLRKGKQLTNNNGADKSSSSDVGVNGVVEVRESGKYPIPNSEGVVVLAQRYSSRGGDCVELEVIGVRVNNLLVEEINPEEEGVSHNFPFNGRCPQKATFLEENGQKSYRLTIT